MLYVSKNWFNGSVKSADIVKYSINRMREKCNFLLKKNSYFVSYK